jgi:tRNA A-37 threonylcarbamoyl transferase component Bud32
MGSLKTPPRLGLRVPLPPAPREGNSPAEGQGLAQGDLLEGRYQIEDRVGEGGVGFVYRALQLKLHRRVAVKLLQSDSVGDEALKPRFEREALTLAALSHPNIVSLNDYGVVRGQPFIVMELLEGRTLRDMLDKDGALAPERALSFARQILLALAYAHSLGIVHRDLKPANLLVQALPCVEHLKILDFGLVKLLPGSLLDSGVQLSRIGFTFGTPSYMSPEHASGAEIDGRADLYALGVLLFEMLTGKKPFEGELQDVLRHHFQTPVPIMAAIQTRLAARPELQELVAHAMAKHPDDRFDDAAAMLAAVDAAMLGLRKPSAAQEVTALVPLQRFEMRELSAGAQRAGVKVLQRTRETLRAVGRQSVPALKRSGVAVGLVLRNAAIGTRHWSQRAWVFAKPRVRTVAAQVVAWALSAGRRLRTSTARLRAGDSPMPTSIVDVPEASQVPTVPGAGGPPSTVILAPDIAVSALGTADTVVADTIVMETSLPEGLPEADQLTIVPASELAPEAAQKQTPSGASGDDLT